MYDAECEQQQQCHYSAEQQRADAAQAVAEKQEHEAFYPARLPCTLPNSGKTGARSSAVERPAHNWLRVGSNPTGPTCLTPGAPRNEGRMFTTWFRTLALVAAAPLAACSGQSNSAAGHTPVPSNTTMAQANSTQAPTQALSKAPGSKYIAKTGALHDVVFEVWANGLPLGTIQWPNKAMDITAKMRGHANQVVIKWTKLQKDGTGTLSIEEGNGVKQMTAVVTNDSPTKGSYARTVMAQQAPMGNGLAPR